MEMDRVQHPRTLIVKHTMIPAEHGAWVFLLSPLAVGLVLGGRFTVASFLLVIALLAAFLIRQPVTVIVKALSGRRPRSELGPARFWLVVYGALGSLAGAGLLLLGNAYIFLLAIPAVPVFGWHLWLVRRRAERRQMLMEMAGGAVLALASPAAYWVGKGQYDPLGWLLWGLAWLQTAGSIIYTYLRLQQRRLAGMPAMNERLRMGIPAFGFNTLVMAASILMAVGSITPLWLPLAYAVQWAEVVWGIARPAVRVKPAWIGVRQLGISVLYTIVFILAWSAAG